MNVLNGEAIEIAGVGFAGICGFGGGFGRRMLNAWGEPLIKQFVQESISHAVRLEQALAKLQTEKRIVVLHYSPIRDTLQGEDPEIYAFLGSSRLEEPINRFKVTAVFHGHAHNGLLDGKTSTGIPVYNVSGRSARPVTTTRLNTSARSRGCATLSGCCSVQSACVLPSLRPRPRAMAPALPAVVLVFARGRTPRLAFPRLLAAFRRRQLDPICWRTASRGRNIFIEQTQVRIQLIADWILRSGANNSVQTLQFFIRRELYKERLDKLVGLIDAKQFEIDSLALTRAS